MGPLWACWSLPISPPINDQKMKGSNRDLAISVGRRLRTVAERIEIDPISTKQSLGVLVQFHVLLIAKSRIAQSPVKT